MQTLSSLTALSPLDGRYARQCEVLRGIFSESAFMNARVRVEVEWLIALSEAGFEELAPISAHGQAFLRGLADNFTESDCEEIKTIEARTNHDVKAVEYWIKEKVAHDEELAKASEFVHFACTSEDINNTSHALMLTAGRKALVERLPPSAITSVNLRTAGPPFRCSRARTARPPARRRSARKWPTSPFV